MRHLIINADGYGFTPGISRAIEDCIEFGTVRSLSANVNFKWADGLYRLVQKHPDLSVGCHINPIVGRPVMAPEKVPTLVNEQEEFFYRTFVRRFLSGRIRLAELRAEMMAQANKTRDLAGAAFSHVDFHMGLHRVPGLYQLFLEVAEKSGARRIRTHRYLVGMENKYPRLRHLLFMFQSVTRIPKFSGTFGSEDSEGSRSRHARSLGGNNEYGLSPEVHYSRKLFEDAAPSSRGIQRVRGPPGIRRR